jgi:hypothetical protein
VRALPAVKRGLRHTSVDRWGYIGAASGGSRQGWAYDARSRRDHPMAGCRP